MTDEARNPIEFRAAETLGVRHPQRIIEVLAMPYERPTHKVRHQGRQITEVVSRGAFDGVEHRHNIRVYRDHDTNRPVGKALKIYTDRPEGLVAELRIAPTPLGDETLELAADGILDVSVGFAPKVHGGEQWSPDRQERRLVKCYLDHIAMVGDPAYDEAQVIDVRSVAVVAATPNLDAIRAELAGLGVRLRY